MRETAPNDMAYTSDVVCAFFAEYADGRVFVCGRVDGHAGRHYDEEWFGPTPEV